jgi:uncharacterized protein (DUF1330 family)
MSVYFMANIRIHDSKEYQEILQFRLSAAECNATFIQGT